MIFVYVYEQGNPPALCLPVRPDNKWAEFKEVIRNSYDIDPDEVEMTYFDKPFQPQNEKSLSELGIRHKGLLKLLK
jgi:hypothetical protein